MDCLACARGKKWYRAEAKEERKVEISVMRESGPGRKRLLAVAALHPCDLAGARIKRTPLVLNSENVVYMNMPKRIFIGTLSLLLPLLIVAQQQTEKIDLNVLHEIKTAELGGGGGGGGGGRGGGAAARRPPIMETLYSLTDRYGPRLTNSPQFRAAGEWAVGQLKEWGMSNVHLEKFATAPAPGAAADAADDTADAAAAGGGRGGGGARRAAIPSWQLVGYSGAMVEPT